MADYGSKKREEREQDRRDAVDDLHDRHARDREDDAGEREDGDGPDQVWVRGEGGALLVFDEPLPLGIQHRLNRGQISRVNEDGTPWVPPAPDEDEGTDAVEQMAEARGRTGIISGDNAVIGGQAAALPVPPVEVLPPEAGGLNTEPAGGEDEDRPEDAPGLPARNASQKAWADFAVSQGMERGEAAGMTRDDLVEEFTKERNAP